MEFSPGGGCVGGDDDDGILAGVTAFVDVWSSNRTENYSKMFSKQLLNLGAKVSKTFNKQVTHVIFKDGSQSTWDKAVKSKVKLVSVLWVEKCRETVMHVEESVYPAINTNTDLPQLNKKKRKCMQPKDFVERTPENNKRFARKFDKMCKDLDVQKDIPRLSFNNDDDDWTVLYSPKAVIADRCNAMEKRIQEMKNKRENLSPTASQMSQLFDFSSLKPSPGNSPSVMMDSPHENDIGSVDTSNDELFESVLKGGSVPSTPNNYKIPVDSVSSKLGLSTPKTERDKSSPEMVKSPTRSQTRSRKSNRFKLFDCTDVDGDASPLTVKEAVDVHSRSLENRTVSKLRFDAVDRKTTNSLTQISHKYQKTNAKVKAAPSTTDSDSGGDAFYETIPKKERVSGPDYSSMANRLIAMCKEKQSKKTGRCSLKYEVPVPHAKNKAVKVEAKSGLSSCTTDSDDGFSNFEDFFTSADLTKLGKRSRFSLTLEPRSPSPPPLTSNNKDCRKPRSVGAALQGTYTAKKRKYSATYSDSSPLENSDSNKHYTSSRKSVASSTKQSPVTSEPETSICLKKSEGAENGVKRPSTSVKNTESPVMCEKMQENLYLTNGTDNGKQMKLFQLSIESKTSASDAIGGLSEMFNEQRNKCTVESRKTEKGRKITRSLVMTSMSSEKQSTIIQVVKKFGNFVFSNEVCETTTHVITGSPRRTLNIILGIARGCWILSYDWVLWSLECGHWIPEEPYELSDDFPGAPVSAHCMGSGG
ncbi:microcephalin isoform X2 [Eleutherodactylus coqui]|uniref:microcephalin isoform X2 n=1 Tax=Eleutherodactylus coqui TaxID=57060 RepID=UPI0034621589